MPETFKANPSEVAGLANLVTRVGEDASTAGTFIGTEGHPEGWLNAPIINQLLTPVREAADATKQRMSSIGTTTRDTGIELNKVAWMYSDQEHRNYEALNNHTFLGPVGPDQTNQTDAATEAPGITSPYLSAASYSKPEEFKLEKPLANKEDTVALIGEVAPILGDLNESIKNITRTAGNEIDPLGKCLEPIPGNWNEVRRIGEAYKAAGSGLEACGKNLEAGLKRADPTWDGKAALAFNDWADRQIAAMKWEGPVGRVLSDVFGVVADEIRQAIKTILQKFWDILNNQIDFKSVKGIFKTIGKKIPIVGQAYEIVDLGRKLYTIIVETVHLVKQIQTLVDKVKKLLEFIKDPIGQLKDKAEQKLKDTIEPFNSALEKSSKKVAIAADLAQIAQINSTTDRPDNAFNAGTGTQPWENS